MTYTKEARNSIDISNKDIDQYNKDIGPKSASNILLGAIIHLLQGHVSLGIEKIC